MDPIDRQYAIDKFESWLKVEEYNEGERNMLKGVLYELRVMPSAQPEIIRCKDCKHNPQNEWFGCPMANLSEQRRPEDAWCWKGEKRTDEDTV